MSDLPDRQKEMAQEDPNNRGLIRGSIDQINQERNLKR